MAARVRHWLKRYLPAEAASVVSALLAAHLAAWLTGNAAVAAVAGAWGENTAYYGVMLFREVLATRDVLRAARDLVIEFGPAEALDSLVVRPAAMFAGTQVIGDLTLGTLAGKLVADVAFYIPAIAAYEVRRSASR
jgi:hypothetical protein